MGSFRGACVTERVDLDDHRYVTFQHGGKKGEGKLNPLISYILIPIVCFRKNGERLFI